MNRARDKIFKQTDKLSNAKKGFTYLDKINGQRIAE